jgi:hypothetical protein
MRKTALIQGLLNGLLGGETYAGRNKNPALGGGIEGGANQTKVSQRTGNAPC